ncbi:MAG TPA: NAD(P)-binding protein [Solirubrobacteraceae bacterium]|jgi:phytoene dehydrogenase-like protein|nr:NAD(P)-binding protein [Solirubrobacteraceae bacterium]
MSQITVVGGGLAGLTAAIACAEGGAKVRLLEAHEQLGGRARSADGPYKANLGPHALYSDGAMWGWLSERGLLPNHVRPPLSGARFRHEGRVHRTPPLGTIPAVLRLRGRQAPVEQDFRGWVESHTDERVAAMLSSIAGVYTFHHDPGELSAAFVQERTVRLFLSTPPPSTVVRYASGGWSGMVAPLERRVRELGVEVHTGHRVDALPEPPVVIATELHQASALLNEPLSWKSGNTVCLDVGLARRRGDPWIVSDMDESGWIGRYSSSDRTIAPEGHELIQTQMPIRPGESAEQAGARLERLIDQAVPNWRERETWRRRQVMDARSGALDPPGSTWRERPAVDRGEGVYLAGDMVAAPGLLAEVSWASGLEAARLALAATHTNRPQLRKVA